MRMLTDAVARRGATIAAAGRGPWIWKMPAGSSQLGVALWVLASLSRDGAWAVVVHIACRGQGRRCALSQAAARAVQAAPDALMFSQAADYIAGYKCNWKNKKHGQQWENTLAICAYSILGKIDVLRLPG